MLAAAGLGEAAATEVAEAIVKSAEAGGAASWASVSDQEPPTSADAPQQAEQPLHRPRPRSAACHPEAPPAQSRQSRQAPTDQPPSGSGDTNA